MPIIPDEARTFGLDALFREVGIYSSKGQLYEPVDSKSLLYYNETKDGQILEEGITEAGSMASFVAAGTAYATHGRYMVPFYIYYSMFGFQRIGDLMWLAGDIRAKGFLLGATSGRTTLNGEGLQHQDGHSLILSSTIPTLVTYDPAFTYELAVIIADGMRRMYVEGEDVFYYLTLYNENYEMPPMPEGVAEGILKGLYKFKAGPEKKALKAHIFGSGPIIREALRAQEILAEQFDVSADVWSATSYKLMRNDALRAKRWNMLHPTRAAEEVLRGDGAGGRAGRVRRRLRQHEDRARPDRALGAGRVDDAGHRRLWPQRHAQSGCAASSKWTPNRPSSPRFMRWRKRGQLDKRVVGKGDQGPGRGPGESLSAMSRATVAEGDFAGIHGFWAIASQLELWT